LPAEKRRRRAIEHPECRAIGHATITALEWTSGIALWTQSSGPIPNFSASIRPRTEISA
jgi:hypothetical protein